MYLQRIYRMISLGMKRIEWDDKKNHKLRELRNISFEEIVIAVHDQELIDVKKHHNIKKYPNQKILLVNLNNYIYIVPFVEDENKIFLKTIIPSRKFTKQYLLKNMI